MCGLDALTRYCKLISFFTFNLQLTRRLNVIHRAEHDTVTTKQPRSETVNYAVRKALQGTVYHCRSFKSVEELHSAIVTA